MSHRVIVSLWCDFSLQDQQVGSTAAKHLHLYGWSRSADYFFRKFNQQKRHADGWTTHHRHWLLQACSLQLWAHNAQDAAAGLQATSEVCICIPMSPDLHRVNTPDPPALNAPFTSAARCSVMILPVSGTAHHDNALNCLQSDQQMTAVPVQLALQHQWLSGCGNTMLLSPASGLRLRRTICCSLCGLLGCPNVSRW